MRLPSTLSVSFTNSRIGFCLGGFRAIAVLPLYATKCSSGILGSPKQPTPPNLRVLLQLSTCNHAALSGPNVLILMRFSTSTIQIFSILRLCVAYTTVVDCRKNFDSRKNYDVGRRKLKHSLRKGHLVTR